MCICCFCFLAVSFLSVPVTGDVGETVDPNLEPETEFAVDIDAGGDASWSVTERYNLTSDSDEAAFETLAADFETDGDYNLGLDAFEEAVSGVDETTERSVALTNVERTAAVETEDANRTGELTLNFTWEGFAQERDDQLVIDDVLTTNDGLWFRGLQSDQTLVIRPPDDYGVENASVAPEGGHLHWEGPVDFDEQSLRATFVGTDELEEGGSGVIGFIPFAFLALALVVTVLALVVLRREQLQTVTGRVLNAEETGSSVESNDVASDASEASTATAQSTGSETTPGVDESTHSDDEETEEDEIDIDLLSDEERVERLLEQNTGRMKQAQIVKETGWSNAKVSQLLSAMEENGQIDKLRIGRENLISFPDDEEEDDRAV